MTVSYAGDLSVTELLAPFQPSATESEHYPPRSWNGLAASSLSSK